MVVNLMANARLICRGFRTDPRQSEDRNLEDKNSICTRKDTNEHRDKRI